MIFANRTLPSPPCFSVVFLYCILSLLATPAFAGWSVSPIRIELGPQARTHVINVFNDSDKPLTVETSSKLWTQDELGADLYTDTNDLVFFPKVLTLAAQETRVIRVGIKVPTTANEKTYRLFIKEKERKSSAGKTGISILVNFGVPIFSQPLKTLEKGEVASAQLDNGDLNLRIRNTGNLSFQIKEIAITGIGTTGMETYRETLNGWYLLAGAERTYKAKINQADCLQTNRIDTMVKTLNFEFDYSFAVDSAMCGD